MSGDKLPREIPGDQYEPLRAVFAAIMQPGTSYNEAAIARPLGKALAVAIAQFDHEAIRAIVENLEYLAELRRDTPKLAIALMTLASAVGGVLSGLPVEADLTALDNEILSFLLSAGPQTVNGLHLRHWDNPGDVGERLLVLRSRRLIAVSSGRRNLVRPGGTAMMALLKWQYEQFSADLRERLG